MCKSKRNLTGAALLLHGVRQVFQQVFHHHTHQPDVSYLEISYSSN